MAAHVELRFIAKIIQQRDLRTVMKSNISQTMLTTPEAREMFKAIRSHYLDSAHYGRVPTARWMKEKFRSFQPMKAAESLEELCEEIRKLAMTIELEAACEEVIELAAVDPYRALEIMRSKALRAQSMTSNSRDLLFSESAEELKEAYERRENATQLLGVPWPWKELNEETQGIQQEDFIIFFARPKTLKSWVATLCGVHAYAYGNRRVMYYSCEMPTEQVRERAACIYAGLDYKKLKKGELSPEEKAIYFAYLDSIKEAEARASSDRRSPGLLFTHFMDAPGGGGVTHMMGKAEAFQPDLIICDAFYRMRNDRTGRSSRKPSEQAEITMDLKNATQQLKVPIIGVTQRNRQGETDKTEEEETATDVAFTDAGGQEADLFIRWSKGHKHPDGSINITGMIAGAREIEPGGMLFRVKPASRWDFVSWLNDQGKAIPGIGSGPNEVVRTAARVDPDAAFASFEQ
jgi:replicative DNA helicase